MRDGSTPFGFLPHGSHRARRRRRPPVVEARALRPTPVRAAIVAGIAFALAGAFAAVAPLPVAAHHGWLWAEDENSELEGVIEEVRLGNPHGLLTVRVGDEVWTVEVGQPWRNERAGLTDGKLAPGVAISASGHRASDASKKLFKAERIVIDGVTYNLYPDRD